MTRFSGSNFIGGDWENGFNLHFEHRPTGEVSADYAFAIRHQGPPGIVHGGALAAVLDEAMTAAMFAHRQDHFAFTVNLNIDYRAPVAIGQPIRIQARVEEHVGRKLTLHATIDAGDQLLVEARGLFIYPQLN